jgi:hypothetical protein
MCPVVLRVYLLVYLRRRRRRRMPTRSPWACTCPAIVHLPRCRARAPAPSVYASDSASVSPSVSPSDSSSDSPSMCLNVYANVSLNVYASVEPQRVRQRQPQRLCQRECLEAPQVDLRHRDDEVLRVLAKERLQPHPRHHPGRLDVQPVRSAAVLSDRVVTVAGACPCPSLGQPNGAPLNLALTYPGRS